MSIYLENKNKIIKNKFNVSIKDNISTLDWKTTASSLFLKKFSTHYDATIVKLLKNNDVNIIGKVNLDEFGLGNTGLSSAFGFIKNPLNSDHIIGGSSSGSAASMLIDDIDASIASDTGDSIRVPASYAGLVGFKPSYGLVSRYGLFSYSSSLDTIGWFTNNVNDSIKLSKILFFKDSQDMTSKSIDKIDTLMTKPKKVGIIFDEEHYPKYMTKSMKVFFKLLEENNIDASVVDIDFDLLNSLEIIYKVISFSEASSNLSNLTSISFGEQKEGLNWEEIMTNSRSKGLSDLVKRRLVYGSFFTNEENQKEIFELAKKGRRYATNWFNDKLDKFDIVIHLSTTSIAPKINDVLKNKKLISTSNSRYISLQLLSNFSGNPSMTLKFDKFDNLPFGITINSKRFSDYKLQNYALYLEKLIGDNYD